MDNIYNLNLATLLKTLAAMPAILTTELPNGVPGHVGPCQGYIRVHNNAILMCAIVSNGRVIIEGMQALQCIENNKAWRISFPPDLLDNIASSSPPKPHQRRHVTRPLTQEEVRYPPYPVQQSPTTEPLSPPSVSSGNANLSSMTGPLSRREILSTEEGPPSHTSSQYETSATSPGFIPEGKVFQPRKALTQELIEKYNAKERLLLRTVYTKINGQRRVDQLKDELRLPAVTIERTLGELYRLGIID